jgi:hypothetical protein
VVFLLFVCSINNDTYCDVENVSTVKMKKSECLDMTPYSLIITKASEEDVPSTFKVKDMSMG